MKTIQKSFLALFASLTLLWLLANYAALGTTTGVFGWRQVWMQYSGVLGMGAMSVAMLLAVRPKSLEAHLHGLDKMYRLHKWLGIAALVLAVTHWLGAQGVKWLVQGGWLTRPARGPRPEQTVDIFRFFQSQRGLAEQVGEWAFYAAVLLITIALIKRFPYRHFFTTHRWLALAYLALVWHAVVLLNFADWATPLGGVMGALMLAGSAAAGVSLFRRIGIKRKAVGVIEQLEYLDGVSVNAVTVQLQNRWAGHEAGQFAFVTFDAKEGAHPFTIASAWQGDGKLLFLIKALGDYTRTLGAALKPGAVAEVEGPYGRFNFDGATPRQIWIGGGIGITPFVARMQALAARPDGRAIDLFHTTTDVDDAALQRLADDAQAAGVRLHLMIDARDGRLSGERLRAEVPHWQSADVWFCGPAGFGDAIRRDLLEHGLAPGHFHQELFAMR